MSSKSSLSSDNNGKSNASYLWKYVSVATDYVGLTSNTQNKALTKSQPNLHHSHNGNTNHRYHCKHNNTKSTSRADLYSEIGAECLNYLARLLDCTRPRLNIQKLVTESVLSLMQTNYVLLIEILTFLPFDNILLIIQEAELDIEHENDSKHYQLRLSLDYLLYNDLSGHEYIRDCCLNGYSLQNRNIIWPYLICHQYELQQYHQLYTKYIKHVQFFHHNIIQKDIDRTLIINYDHNTLYKYDYYTHRNKAKNTNDAYINRNHDVLNDQYKKKLKAILSIYCMLDPEVGYIQGMNYIAANVLIAVHGDVHNAFAIFCHLMKHDTSPPYYIDIDYTALHDTKRGFQSHAYCGGGRVSKTGCVGYGLRDLYLPSLPGLIISLLQFEKLIKLYLPKLYQYFMSRGIEVTNYASEWFLSLFSYILPLNVFLRIIDLFICDGWKTLHRAGLAMLYLAQFKILKEEMSFDKILLLLKRKDLLHYLNINEAVFIRLSMSFKVSNKYLHESAVQLLTKSMARSRNSTFSTVGRSM